MSHLFGLSPAAVTRFLFASSVLDSLCFSTDTRFIVDIDTVTVVARIESFFPHESTYYGDLHVSGSRLLAKGLGSFSALHVVLIDLL